MMKGFFLPVMAAVMSGVVFAQTPDSAKNNATTTVSRTAPGSESHAVTVAGIEEVRKTKKDGGFPTAGLKVTLSLSGVDVEKVKSVECNLTMASDDTGRNLIKKETGFFDKTEFHLDENSDSFEVSIHLKSPARKAACMNLEGTLDMFVPTEDPAATIKIADAKKTAGIPVKSEALQAVKASIVVAAPKKNKTEKPSDTNNTTKEAMGDDKDEAAETDIAKGMQQAFSGMFGMNAGPNSITLEIVDPEGKIQGIEFFSNAGKQIKSNGSSSIGDPKRKLSKTLNFDEPLPETAEMRIYVTTPQAVKKVPFSLMNIALP